MELQHVLWQNQWRIYLVSDQCIFIFQCMTKKKKNIILSENNKEKINLKENLLIMHPWWFIQTMGESMLIFAPNANSWRRLVLRILCTNLLRPNWGIDNRSVAFRIPSSKIKIIEE